LVPCNVPQWRSVDIVGCCTGRWVEVGYAPAPTHPLLPFSYPHLQLSQRTIIRQLQSNLQDAATQPTYHQYLSDKYNWNADDPDQIQWHAFRLAYNRFNKQEQKTIAKFNHNWLPLQTSHHVHSTSKQQICPSCRSHQETADHFLVCPHTDQESHWTAYIDQIQKHITRNPVPHDFHELLLVGLQISRNSAIAIPQHLNQNPRLTPIIQQQSRIGWRHLLYGRTIVAWYDYMRRHAFQINSFHFFAKIIQLGW